MDSPRDEPRTLKVRRLRPSRKQIILISSLALGLGLLTYAGSRSGPFVPTRSESLEDALSAVTGALLWVGLGVFGFNWFMTVRERRPSTPAPRMEAPTAGASGGISGAAVCGALGSAGIVVGSMMPWAYAGPFSVAGTRGDGVITLLLGAALFGLAFFLRLTWARFAAAGLAGLTMLIAGYDLSRASMLTEASDGPFEATLGPGLPVVMVGAVAVAISVLIAASSPDSRSRPRRMVEIGSGRIYDEIAVEPVAGDASFCTSCGTPLGDGARFCSKCGTPTAL